MPLTTTEHVVTTVFRCVWTQKQVAMIGGRHATFHAHTRPAHRTGVERTRSFRPAAVLSLVRNCTIIILYYFSCSGGSTTTRRTDCRCGTISFCSFRNTPRTEKRTVAGSPVVWTRWHRHRRHRVSNTARVTGVTLLRAQPNSHALFHVVVLFLSLYYNIVYSYLMIYKYKYTQWNVCIPRGAYNNIIILWWCICIKLNLFYFLGSYTVIVFSSRSKNSTNDISKRQVYVYFVFFLFFFTPSNRVASIPGQWRRICHRSSGNNDCTGDIATAGRRFANCKNIERQSSSRNARKRVRYVCPPTARRGNDLRRRRGGVSTPRVHQTSKTENARCRRVLGYRTNRGYALADKRVWCTL